MKPGRGRIAPLALVLLIVFLSLPFLLYSVPAQWWRGELAYEPPRRIIEWTVARGDSGAAPTDGMTIGSDGFGTVTAAPAVLARRAPDSAPSGYTPEHPLAPDIERFIRMLPRERLLNPPKDGITTCTLEGPPLYAGRIVLVNGCLRFHDEGAAKPGLLVLGIGSVYRDADNYLTVGLRDAVPEYEIRVGEPGGVFIGVGCSMDDPVTAPANLARACGVSQMRRLATIKRKPLCSDAQLLELARRRAEFAPPPPALLECRVPE